MRAKEIRTKEIRTNTPRKVRTNIWKASAPKVFTTKGMRTTRASTRTIIPMTMITIITTQ